MFRRPLSTAMSRLTPQGERAPKRQRRVHLTSDSFKNGVFLAPMVRSGACTPTKFSLMTTLLTMHHSTNSVDRPQTRRIPRLGPRNRRQGHPALGTRRRP